jgi:pimeloyl-ACP methyl ester carboxylesterase
MLRQDAAATKWYRNRGLRGRKQLRVLFLHGYGTGPGGLKPTYLAKRGLDVINTALSNEDFDEAVRAAQAAFDAESPDVVAGSSMGGAVAMNIDSGEVPLVLVCPAWRHWGAARTVKPNTILLHSRQDETIDFADSEALVRASDLPASALWETGNDHRLVDEASLDALYRAIRDSAAR